MKQYKGRPEIVSSFSRQNSTVEIIMKFVGYDTHTHTHMYLL